MRRKLGCAQKNLILARPVCPRLGPICPHLVLNESEVDDDMAEQE